MPGSVSPPRGPRRRSPSPRRDRERDDRRDRPRDEDRRERDRPRDDDRRDRDRRDDRGGDRDRRSDRDRDERPRPRDSDSEINRDADRGPSSGNRRTPSPPRRSKPKTKELSFYKKSSSSMGSFSHRRDPLALDNIEESAKERMERRAMGEVPARFGGTREQGVRNTMSTIAPSTGSATRGGGDPLDRMPAKGGVDGDRMMAERVAAMGGGAPAGGAAAGPPSGIPTYVSPSLPSQDISYRHLGASGRC
jgi:hypothetical protein